MIYTGEKTREISFPIGGIGTGSFGIAGNGSFIDWEIFNKPNKGSVLDNSHIAVKAKVGEKVYVKILNGDLTKDIMGQYEKGYMRGYGYGPWGPKLAGMSHFKHCEFNGEFPIAKLTFWDEDFPGRVVMTVFNPFIPLDSFNSGIPAGFFDIDIINDTDEDIEYTAVFSMANPFKKSVNTALEKDGYKILNLYSDLEKTDKEYGDISVCSNIKNAEIQRYWYRGEWYDNLDVYLKELLNSDKLSDRVYSEEKPNWKPDLGSVASHISVNKGGTGNVKFTLSWNVPNAYNYWVKTEEERPTWKNYYATVFDSSVESCIYSQQNFCTLLSRTLEFKNALYGSSLDPVVIEAAAANLSVLKSPTVLRLEDGSFWGWEGVMEKTGSCEGTCQHVWNYAYALCFLFPDLEKSIRDNEFKYCTYDSGMTVFRMPLPMGAPKPKATMPCLDGQMGIVIKTYREWKISGDTKWLKSVWETVKKVLSFAWSEENFCKWDADKDGVLEGRQHHTLDMELFGPSGWLQGFYLAALKAATEMAEFLGDTKAAGEYSEIFEKGYAWTKENLFNGEYFIQKTDMNNKKVIDEFGTVRYWYEEKGELKYQIDKGCEIDQVCGQWHANLCGLGGVFDKGQLKSALKSLYKYNFIPCMRDYHNTWRVFSLNEEAGAIICSFPKGAPTIPLPYYSETMTGFEYALAGLMISEGMEKEGTEIVKAIRSRFDGEKRNPWNEYECGSNYARSMASFALLPIYSGFSFDLPNNKIGFNPIHKENFNCFFSVGTGYGILQWSNNKISVIIKEGYLNLKEFAVSVNAKEVLLDGKSVDFESDGNSVKFECQKINKSLVVIL